MASKVRQQIEGIGRTNPVSASGPVAFIIEDPSGSSVTLVYSSDDGATWEDVPNEGSTYTFTDSAAGEIANHGPNLYALECTSYLGVPFWTTLSAN